MSIQLSENESRVAYTLAESVVQSLFAVPFEFFDDGDLLVFVDGVQKAEGADYTVAGGGGSTGSITFSPALTGGVGGTSVLIVRRIPVERVTDFLPGSDINRTALNEQLDILTAMIADVNDKVERSVRIGDADLGSTLLPEKDVRKGTVLGFDSTTGSVSSIPVDALSGFDSFYLGTFAIAPTTKLDGSPLVQGNLYFNSASSLLFVWDGAAWVDFSAPFGTMAAQDADNVSITGGSFSGITSLSGSVIASQGEAQAGTNPSKIPTVLRVAEQTTARLASQAEAQAGSDNTKLMTPLRTAEAIAALTPPVTALSQAQVQNAGDTTFGTVSGQRLAQAVNAFSPGVTTASVLDATAGASAGAVGTYVFARSNSNVSFGSTVSGSSLSATSAVTAFQSIALSASFPTTSTPSGTWRCMGRFTDTVTFPVSDPIRNIRGATLWLRIS